jgi:3'(2'), 5'-bisphosphate nucleotidase
VIAHPMTGHPSSSSREANGANAANSVVSPADHAEAARLAREAGRLLVELRACLGAGIEMSAEQARAEADRRSHEFLARAIEERYPGDGLLSEEGADSAARLGLERVWIVDPLDGTREFGEVGRSDWAVHVCLSVAGRVPVGAVALPGLGTVLSTAEPPATNARLPGPLRIVVSRTRPPAAVERLAALLSAELVPMGSAGAKAMAVVRGEADAYLHSGGQYEWDSAAPVAVALSAGLHASRLDGSQLVYNQPDPWLPDLVICRPDVTSRVFTALAEMDAEQRP